LPVELATLERKFARAKECCEGKAPGSIELVVSCDDSGLQSVEHCEEDWESDWTFRATVRIPVEAFNSPEKSLDHGGIADGEGDIGVCMHGSNVAQVRFDGGRLDLPCEGADPGHDGWLRGWQDGSVSIILSGESNMLNV
jgi:hypothetical protein